MSAPQSEWADITSEEQIEHWVAGESVHRRGPAWLTGGECCPDFSCCRPELLQPVEVRRAFQVAGPKVRSDMLSMFLKGLVAGAAPDLQVYIAGDKPEAKS